MKIVVESQSGPCMIAWTTCSIQLSPWRIEYQLCWLFSLFGRTTEKFGRVPACASETTSEESTMFVCCGVSMQSAKVGQIAQPYGMDEVPDRGGPVLA